MKIIKKLGILITFMAVFAVCQMAIESPSYAAGVGGTEADFQDIPMGNFASDSMYSVNVVENNKDNNIWLTSNNRIARYDNGWKNERIWPAGGCSNIAISKTSRIWCISGGNIYYVDGLTANGWTAIPNWPYASSGKTINSMDTAPDGSLWVGGQDGYMARWNGSAWEGKGQWPFKYGTWNLKYIPIGVLRVDGNGIVFAIGTLMTYDGNDGDRNQYVYVFAKYQNSNWTSLSGNWDHKSQYNDQYEYTQMGITRNNNVWVHEEDNSNLVDFALCYDGSNGTFVGDGGPGANSNFHIYKIKKSHDDGIIMDMNQWYVYYYTADSTDNNTNDGTWPSVNIGYNSTLPVRLLGNYTSVTDKNGYMWVSGVAENYDDTYSARLFKYLGGFDISAGTLTATSVTLNINWDGKSVYNMILQKSTDGTNFSDVKYVSGKTCSDTGLNDGTSYWYRLVSSDREVTSQAVQVTTQTVPAPTITIGQPSVTSAKSGPVTYTITYGNADSISLASSNVILNRTGTANGTVSVSGTGNTTRTVTISNITGDGTLGISITAGTASNAAGKTAPAAGPSTTFTVDNAPPTLTISAPSAASTKSGPVTYTVTYADTSGIANITLTASNITLNKTGTANGTIGVSGTGTTTRTVTISGITGEGTLGITIAAGTASDAIGNKAPAAGPSTVFTADNVPPVLTLNPDAGTFQGDVSAAITCTDGGSGIKTSKYIWSESSTAPADTDTNWKDFTSPEVIKQYQAKTWYLHIQATDQIGNRTNASKKYVIVPKMAIAARPNDGTTAVAGTSGRTVLLNKQGQKLKDEVWQYGSTTNIYAVQADGTGRIVYAGQDGNWQVRKADGSGATIGAWAHTGLSIKTITDLYKNNASTNEMVMAGNQGRWQVVTIGSDDKLVLTAKKGTSNVGEVKASACRMDDGYIVLAGSGGRIAIIDKNKAPDASGLVQPVKQENWTKADKTTADTADINAVIVLPGDSLLFAGQGGKYQVRDSSGIWQIPGTWGNSADIKTLTMLPNGNVLMTGGDGYIQVYKVDEKALGEKGKYMLSDIQAAYPRADGMVVIEGKEWTRQYYKYDAKCEIKINSATEDTVILDTKWDNEGFGGNAVIEMLSEGAGEWGTCTYTWQLNGTQAKVTGLQTGKTYKFRIKANLGSGIYYMSKEVGVKLM